MTVLPAFPVSALVAAFAIASAFGAGRDSGGLSFDFRALSAARFGSAFGSAGDIAAGAKARKAYGFVYNSAWTDSSAGVPAADVVKCTDWREMPNGEFVVSISPDILKACRGDADIAAYAMASWETRLCAPDSGVYRLAFDYKMNHSIGSSGRCVLRANGRFEVNAALENCDSEWKPFVSLFTLKPGCTNIQVNINFSGAGSLRYRNLSIVPESCATPVVLTTCAHGQVDKSFAVGAGQVGCITYMWKRRYGDPGYEAGRFTFRMSLPKGFDFVAATWAKKGEAVIKRRADGRSIVSLPAKGRESPTYSYRDSNWTRFGVLVRAAEDAEPGIGAFEALYDGKVVSNIETTRWFTIPPVRVSAKPKRYRNGFFPGSGYGVYDDAEASYAYAKMASDAGADWWIPSVPPKPSLVEIYRRAGISVITPQTGGIREGYVINGGSYLPLESGRPAEDRYVARTAKSDPTIAQSCCPFSVIEERPYFLTNTMARVRRALAGVDGIWANWEPYVYVNEGCMCDRCRRAFAEFVGVPEAEMTRDAWWKEARSGGRYAAENRRFRSLTHARLVRTVDRHIRLMTGGERSFGLIPGIAWCEMSSYWRPNDYPVETKAIDYAGDLKWIDPWGPYPFWNLDTIFAQKEGFNVVYWFAAKDVREQVNKDYPAGRRPKLMSFPQGAMSCEWITEPEWLGLGLDSFFFNGWEASVVYFFPKGYDARYWRAFAEATSRAAKYEDFVFDGRRCDGEVSVVTPGFDQRFPGAVSQYLSARDVSLVQHAAYEKDGWLVVAVLNFADAQPARVDISHPRYRSASGVVPAARCRVFELSR